MSGSLRFRLVAVLILAGLSTSPASSNPFDALFNRAPEEVAAPKDALAQDECLPQPGKPTDGQHWVYHLDGHRKCWFLVPEETAMMRKRVHHRAARRRLAAADEDEAAPRKRRTVAAALAEPQRAAPAETPPPAPAFKVADAVPVPTTGAAALVPPPPAVTKPDQLTPDNPDPGPENVETSLAATPANSVAVAVSTPPASPVAVPIVETGDDGRWWTTKWLGPLLMVLGLISLLMATRPLRRAVLVAKILWAQEPQVGPALRHSEPGSQTRPHHRHQPQAPQRSRDGTEDQRTTNPSGQGNREMSFQEAISALTDFDTSPLEARSAPRSLADAAPVFRKTRTKVSNMN